MIIECNFAIENNTFINNSAFHSGGAIFYNLYSPKGLINNYFSGNRAIYGSSIGSFAFTLKLMNTT
jgi:hypothetical protein